ncbi:MAG: hypothetical protein LBU34_13195 [Planctomycetaceae bacterium]|nr:hypothetical protein [Planctomycetaceae bacterium]
MPFQGVNSYLWTLTRRVAAGWILSPLQGVGRQPLAVAVASALADNEFMLCWMF